MLAIIMILVSLSYIIKENLWFNIIFKKQNLDILLESQIILCLLYFSIAYIYLNEGYFGYITYIYDDTHNTEEEKKKKKLLAYRLILTYIVLVVVIYFILKKIMNKYSN